MIKRFHFDPFACFHMTAFAFQYDKAVTLAEGAENMRALMAGGADGQFTVSVALQNAALEIEAARRFFQARGGTHAQAWRLCRAGETAQFRQ